MDYWCWLCKNVAYGFEMGFWFFIFLVFFFVCCCRRSLYVWFVGFFFFFSALHIYFFCLWICSLIILWIFFYLFVILFWYFQRFFILIYWIYLDVTVKYTKQNKRKKVPKNWVVGAFNALVSGLTCFNKNENHRLVPYIQIVILLFGTPDLINEKLIQIQVGPPNEYIFLEIWVAVNWFLLSLMGPTFKMNSLPLGYFALSLPLFPLLIFSLSDHYRAITSPTALHYFTAHLSLSLSPTPTAFHYFNYFLQQPILFTLECLLLQLWI